MMKTHAIHRFLLLAIFCSIFAAPAESQSWKASVRGFFGELSQAVHENEIGSLPIGITRIELPGVSGIRIEPGMAELKPYSWSGEPGLLDRFQKSAEQDGNLVAAINGAFFGAQGILGQLVIDGKRPHGIRQMPASFARCFVAVLNGAAGRRWVIGETAVHGTPLCLPEFFTSSRFNRALSADDRLEHLLGGAGWIIRDGRDVHMEAYGRQKFRFRKVDQDSRHSVIAMDVRDRLYLLVFETGSNLDAVSSMLRTRSDFDNITEAIFMDGGSSSVLIVNGKYLVAPLYLVDKARYTALFVRKAGPAAGNK